MLEATSEAMNFVAPHTREEFDQDRRLQFAVVRCIEIVGEAASRVSVEFRNAHEEIPWARIVSTRNRLIHAYFEIDMEVVWRTATQELPSLAERLTHILED